MEFIYAIARNPKHFAECGDDLLYFFKLVSSRSKDPLLRRMARKMGKECFGRWRRRLRRLPADADPDTIILHYNEDSTAALFGAGDKKLRRQIGEAATRFSAGDFLWFDPLAGPPPADVPDVCRCGMWNRRGRKRCSNRACRAVLAMSTRYEVWYYSLTRAYCAENYGIRFGAGYEDVFRWLPSLRPYRPRQSDDDVEFDDSIYAISHLVYTLGDYGVHNINPRWFPQEYEFLRANLPEAIARRDPDMIGEFIDSLMGFGLTDRQPLIRKGIEFLLEAQNPDGSWGDVQATDLYSRYHPTWAAIDGLREFAWRGPGLRFPALLPLIKKWARES
jgi:hypothetical protein